MLPWTLIDTAQVPGGGELRLKKRGDEFSIMLGSNELMNSRLSGSEEALAMFAADHLKGRVRPRVLIGGLGMGFTLRAALAAFGADAEIVVAELVPAVIAWARGPMAALYGDSLTDARVTLQAGDVAALIRDRRAAFDAILLDVDNGPDGLTREGNDALYDLAGLHAAHAALKPGGLFSVWSSAPDERFTQRLRKAGFASTAQPVRAGRAKRGARHVIWLATR